MSPGVYVSYRGRPRISLGGLGYLRPRRRRRSSGVGAGVFAAMVLLAVGAVLLAGALSLIALALVPFLIGFTGEAGNWGLSKTIPRYRQRRRSDLCVGP
jgi:hypothetical protein